MTLEEAKLILKTDFMKIPQGLVRNLVVASGCSTLGEVRKKAKSVIEESKRSHANYGTW